VCDNLTLLQKTSKSGVRAQSDEIGVPWNMSIVAQFVPIPSTRANKTWTRADEERKEEKRASDFWVF